MVYPKNRFRFGVLANISEEIRAILGDFIYGYEIKAQNYFGKSQMTKWVWVLGQF